MAIPSERETLGLRQRATLEAIAELEKLPTNWDGYGSPPIQRAALASARHLVGAFEVEALPIPSVCPVTGGGIGLTWQTNNRELEIEILPDGRVEFLLAGTDEETGE